MAVYYPNPTTHGWSDLVVGGSAGNPKFFLLDEENKITNGFFKDPLSLWGGAPTRVALGEAMRGSYVMSIAAGAQAHLATAWVPTYALFTGFLRFTGNAASAAQIYANTSNSATYVPSPTKYFRLVFNAAATGISLDEWVPFYMLIDTTGWPTFTHLHLDIRNSGSGTLYVDDLRMHECSEIISMDNPNILSLVWKREIDSEYTLFNGDMKTYVKGWRPSFNLGYEYCSRAQLIKDIDISESTFSFFVPQDDGLMGVYTRLTNDFDSSYFKNKFVGHAQSLELPSIFLQRYKNKQYGTSYFTPTRVA
jgi:hypothetical protein